MNYRRIAKKLTVPAFVLALVLPCYQLTLGQSSSTKSAFTIADLAWMTGGWRTAPGGRAQIEEYWTAPAGGSMMGISRTIAGDKLVEFEFLRLEQRADGIYYVASPKGRCPATDFKLTNLSGHEATFENPQHDFPKRIIYRKNSDGSLVASIDGGAGTKSRSFAYLPVTK
jgi:Domain of unknown function (DUF6265)